MQYEKPGCFGFATTYNVRSKVCQGCDFKEGCKIAAAQAIEVLAEKLNIGAVKKLMQTELEKKQVAKKVEASKSAATVSPVIEKILLSLPTHVRRVAGMVLSYGINHRVNLLNGVNSMKGRKPFSVEILFDLLIQGPVSRAAYLNALKERAEYTNSTASSQASICMSALVAVGIAKEIENGFIVIRGSK